MWHEFGKMKSLQFGPCPIWYHWGTGFMTCSAPTTRGQVSCFGFIYDNSDKLKENVWSFCINSKDNQYNTVSLKIRRYNNEPWFPFKHGHKESQLAAVFPFLSSSLCLSPQRKKKPSEYIFTREAPLHLQSHSSLIFPGTSHSRLIVKDDALAPH